MKRLTQKEQRELEEKLLTPEQLKELRTFDREVARSNRRFYDNCKLIDPEQIEGAACDSPGEWII